jgi:chorismate mutase
VLELSEIRIRLDQMTERIVSRLKDRSRFPRNHAVYRPDGLPIAGRSGISFLEYAIEGLETYHASLGRWAYPDQFALLGAAGAESPVSRAVNPGDAPRVEIAIGPALFAFYPKLLDELCREGEDPGTFGETVYVDADLLQLLHERINIGRNVAVAKLQREPHLREMAFDTPKLEEALKDRAREAALLQTVENTAARYEVDPLATCHLFEWVIDQTLALEVAFLQRTA